MVKKNGCLKFDQQILLFWSARFLNLGAHFINKDNIEWNLEIEVNQESVTQGRI
jgi:hypothetical protein